MLVALGLWLSLKGKYRAGSILTAYAVTSLCFLLAASGLVPQAAIVPQLGACMCICIFLIEHSWHRTLYSLVAIAMLFITGLLNDYPVALAFGFALQMAGFAFLFHCGVRFIERQDQSLQSTVSDLERSSAETALANAKLTQRGIGRPVAHHEPRFEIPADRHTGLRRSHA